MPRLFSIGRSLSLRKSSTAAAAPQMQRAVIETLEDRQLLSSYYVSTTGSDSNPGTLSAPFKTIQKAASTVVAGDTAYIRGGTYREQVNVPRSGASGKPITFKAYNGEKVVVSGADVVKNWSVNSGNVYKANQNWDLGFGKNQVFVDGKMMIEARWPNTTLDVSRPVKASADSGSYGGQYGTIYDAQLKGKSGAFNGAYIQVLPGERWVAQTGKVNVTSDGKLTYTLSASLSSSNDGGVKTGTPYYLTGKFTMLDSAGEWFRDSSGKLYLWTPGSDSPNNHTVEVKKRAYSFDANGRSYIKIEGISTFANTIRIGSYSTISKLDAKYVSQFTLVSNGWVEGNRDSGIIIAGHYSTVKDSRIQFSAGNGIGVQGDNNIITNNIISDVDYAATDTAAVRTTGKNIQVTWNTMYNAGRSIIKHDASPNLKILHNVLHTGGLQTGDLGATYTIRHDGGGTEIAYNRIYNMHTGGHTGATGIYLDQYSTNYVVHHNLVYNSDRGMTTTTPQGANKIYNNTLVATKLSLGNAYKRSMTGSVIRNNIFTNDILLSPGITFSNNLLKGTDPQFVNPAAGDYTLKSTSPAINKGLAVPSVTSGASGTPDLGAFEYGKAAWRAGANLSTTTPTNPPPVNEPTPAPAPNTGSSIIGKTMQAENYNWGPNVQSNNGVLGHTDAGDYVKYNSLNFGSTGATKLTIRYATPAAGGSIDILLDTWNGKKVGTLTTKSTGSWTSFTEVTIDLTKITGTHNLYFAFKGRNGVANIDWFKFS